MKRYSKISVLLLFITITLLCLSVVSASDSYNETTSNIRDTDNIISEDIEETNTLSEINQEQSVDNKNINKTIKNQSKTASKTPVSYDIKIKNKIVKNTTIEIGVINYLTHKAIPYSNLTIKLPDNSIIKTNTMKTGYSNITMNLPVGKNILKIKYDGNSNYYAYDYDLEVKVQKRSTSMQVNVNGSSTTGDIKLTVIILDAHTGKKLKNVNTKVYLPNKIVLNQTTGTKAQAIHSFNLKNGTHIIKVVYKGNKEYLSSKTNLTLNISTKTIKNNVNMGVTFKNLYVGRTALDFKLTDASTKKILPNATIKFKLSNGKIYTKKTNSRGKFTLNMTAPVGKNTIEIIYAGNNTYNKRTEKVNFTVKKRVCSLNLTVTMGTKNKLKVKLTDLVLNKSKSYAYVTVILPNGTKYKNKTDKNGIMYCPIVPKVGNKTYTVIYYGNANISKVTRHMTIYTPKSKAQVTFGVTVKNNYYNADDIVFKLIDVNTNKTLANTPLNILLPSKTVKCVTNAKGEVELKTNMSIGNNKVIISFKGDDNYLARNATVNIVITKRPSQLKGSLQIKTNLILNLTVTDRISNKAIANARVLLKHPAKNITLVSDSQGNIYKEVVLPGGTASIVAQFIGNSMYANSNNLLANITIPKTKN